jgi:hypothetical protein
VFRLRGTTLSNGLQALPADIVHPRQCLPAEAKLQVTKSEREPPGLWNIMSTQFSSRITAIKRLGEGSPEDSADPQRSAMYALHHSVVNS